jgi:phosphonate transport system ATP-binding protein
LEVNLHQVSAIPIGAGAGATPALKQVSLRIAAGESVAVIGPSGAGKTTLLHLIACASRPSSGDLQLGGANPWAASAAQLRALRSSLFLAPQVPPLPPRQRVITSVLAGRLPQQSLWQSLRSLVYPSDIASAHQALEQVDLKEKIFDRVDRLSGGERQRVGLARLIASNAGLLLVDEPLSALDPTRATQVMETLTRVAKERGATLCCTLHHIEMALAHFPRIIGLRQGEVYFDLPAAQVTKERLTALYGAQVDELMAPQAPVDLLSVATVAPVVMNCR